MPFVVHEDRHPELFKFITNRNLLWQYDFLLQSIRMALAHNGEGTGSLTAGLILSLNHFAVVNLTPRPGQLRDDHVHIRNSPHEPPVEWLARELFFKLPGEISTDWNSDNPIGLAARVLWRLNWIHPFEEGNGRTARAACYYCLCTKFGLLLPGRTNLLQLMREEPEPYYAALRHADETLKQHGQADLKPLETYLTRLLITQLQS
jgi:Fic family protein